MRLTAPDPNPAMETYRNIAWVPLVTAAWEAIGRKKCVCPLQACLRVKRLKNYSTGRIQNCFSLTNDVK